MLLYLLREELSKLLSDMGYAVTKVQLQETAAYYLSPTSHDSSLSRVACAGALARLDPAASSRLFTEALNVDWSASSSSSTSSGLHLGAMAGLIDVLERHYRGIHIRSDGIAIDPAIPAELGPVRIRFRCRFGWFEAAWTGAELLLSCDEANAAEAGLASGGARMALPPGATLRVWPT